MCRACGAEFGLQEELEMHSQQRHPEMMRCERMVEGMPEERKGM